MHRILVTALVATLVLLAGPAVVRAGIVWYSTQPDWDSSSHLYSMDLATGTSMDRGVTQSLSLLTDIAFSGDGQLFGVGFANKWGSGAGRLYSLTPGSETNPASFTQLSISGSFSGTPNGLAWFDEALYASTSDSRLYKLVQETDGSWTVAKEGKMNHSSSGDLAFAADGTLYTVVDVGSNSRLATVNYDVTSKHFGKDDILSAKTGYREVFGLAFDDGILYGAASGGNFSQSDLVMFNLRSGAATGVGDFGAAVWGMASGPEGGAVPEPSAVILLSAGIAGLAMSRRRRKARGVS